MKTTIHYDIEHPEAYKHAMKDIKEYLGDRYSNVFNSFCEEYNPCTWAMLDFHLLLGLFGITGFPVRAFAWEVIAEGEASH